MASPSAEFIHAALRSLSNRIESVNQTWQGDDVQIRHQQEALRSELGRLQEEEDAKKMHATQLVQDLQAQALWDTLGAHTDQFGTDLRQAREGITSKLASLRDQVQLVADTASEQRKQIKADLQFQAEMRERENKTALARKTEALEIEVAELRATLTSVEKSVAERTTNAVTRIMQEVDQKMNLTSDMVKANVLEMTRHKDSVSSQLSGYETELGGATTQAVVASKAVEAAHTEISETLANARKKVGELEAVAYRGSDNTSLVSRLRDDVEALQKRYTEVKTGVYEEKPAEEDGWGGIDAESVLWEEIRLMAQWESIGRIQIPGVTPAAEPTKSEQSSEMDQLKSQIKSMTEQVDQICSQVSHRATASTVDLSAHEAKLRDGATERAELEKGFGKASGHRTQLHTELSGLQSQMSDLEAQLSSFAANPAAAALPAALDLGNKIYLVGGATIDNGQDHILDLVAECEISELQNAKAFAPMPSPRSYGGVALLGAKIYVAGGVKDREGGYHNDAQQHAQNLLPAPPLSSVEVYDFQQGSWGVQIEMPADHGGVLWPGVVADAATNKIYVIGGLGSIDKKSSKKVSILDTTTLQWQSGAQIDQVNGRALFGYAALGGKIYISGGVAGKRAAVADMNVYDIATDSWAQLADMPNPRMRHKMVAAAGKLWTVTGQDGGGMFCEDVGCYDPSTNSWSSVPGPVPPRINSAAVANGDHIYLFGGKNPDEQAMDEILRFNTGTQEWEQVGHLPFKRKGMMAISTV